MCDAPHVSIHIDHTVAPCVARRRRSIASRSIAREGEVMGIARRASSRVVERRRASS